MASVGSGASGKTLIGAGNGQGPVYASIGTNSGLTSHGVVIAAGNSAFNATGSGTLGQVLTSNGASADPTFQSVSGIGAITTITGDSGGPESPSAGNFNVLGSGSITTVGSANTETVQLTGLTNHNVLIGAGTSTITKVAPSATSGVPLISQGASSDPAFGTAVVAGGGTGVATITGLVSGNGTSAFVGRTITGTSNQITVTNGSGATANPTLSLPSTIYTNISFDSGSNTLSAYSTGTWTPTVTSNGTPPTVTYGVQRGVYVLIGRLCFLSGLITLGSYSGGTGQLQIGGLPFNAPGDLCFPQGSAFLGNVSYLGNYTCAQVQDVGGTTYIQFSQGAPSSNNGNVTVDKFSASSTFVFSVCYRTT